MRRLKRADLPVDTAALARFLIGKTLVRDAAEGRTSGRIVEAEAYVPGDASGHAYVGESDRNRSLFLRRGHAYVYFIYGMHFCVNVSGERPGIGAGEGAIKVRRRSGRSSMFNLIVPPRNWNALPELPSLWTNSRRNMTSDPLPISTAVLVMPKTKTPSVR
jgi:hypothetical protein